MTGLAATAESSSSRGTLLLSLARASLAQAFGGPQVERPVAAPWLEEPGACFVTLRIGEDLRGCVGSIVAHRSLFDDVVGNAQSSAFHDPRFPPLTQEELEQVRLDISVLTPLEDLPVDGEDDACKKVRPGVDGIELSANGRRAVFIPKMWEQLPEPRQFLLFLRRKAGLPDRSVPGTRLRRFTAECFEEG